MKDYIWLSLGENCLPDAVLKRHGRKFFATPYSHSWSNIYIATQLEETKYDTLIDKINLKYVTMYNQNVLMNTHFKKCDCNFEKNVNCGFTFLHHDILNDKEKYNSYIRKINRMKQIKGYKNILFLYHHRYTNFTLNKLIDLHNHFISFYKINNCNCKVVIMIQNIVPKELRNISISFISHDIMIVSFSVEKIWAKDMSLGEPDDDLFAAMFQLVETLL